jgi:hypothetical protein
VIDLYYADPGARDGFRREVLRIDVADDDEAIAEAKRVDQWRKTDFFEIRAIRNSVRSGDKLIFSTRSAVSEDTTPAVTPTTAP